jgi:type 1 glutamine amidotransferase
VGRNLLTPKNSVGSMCKKSIVTSLERTITPEIGVVSMHVRSLLSCSRESVKWETIITGNYWDD